MRIGDSVLGTYRYFYGERADTKFVDIRKHGVIDSTRLPLGFYWVVFPVPEGDAVRQMNHESEIGGDSRVVLARHQTQAEVLLCAIRHAQAGGVVRFANGKPPVRKAGDSMAVVGKEEVIL